MAKDKIKIVGITFSITFLMFIALAIFIKGLGILLSSWFSTNALPITIISGIIVGIGLLTGSIAIGSMVSKGKSIF